MLYVDDSGDSKNYDSFCDVVPEGLKLEILIYLMFAVIIVVIVLAKWKGTPTGTNQHEVFTVFENKLTVLTGIPVTYEINTIKKITFSTLRDRYGSYTGIMRIVKKDGKKSRSFIFYSTVNNKRGLVPQRKTLKNQQ